jgi:hypothetical protein
MLGINLRHNLQLTGTYGTFAPFGKITNKDNAEVKVTGADEWQDGWGHKEEPWTLDCESNSNQIITYLT